MKIDHIALEVKNPAGAADWYCENFGATLIFKDETWAFVQFENIKLAFVMPDQHPAHIAFEEKSLKPCAEQGLQKNPNKAIPGMLRNTNNHYIPRVDKFSYHQLSEYY